MADTVEKLSESVSFRKFKVCNLGASEEDALKKIPLATGPGQIPGKSSPKLTYTISLLHAF